MQVEQACEQVVAWLREQVTGAGAAGVVVGLSGGIDSAVVAALCQRAFPTSTTCLILPCDSAPEDVEYARQVVDALSLQAFCVDLTPEWEQLVASIEAAIPAGAPADVRRLARANVKPRLRMTVLYYVATLRNALVVGTENWPELTVGYFTKYGDGGVDLLPLAHFLKSEVRALAEYLGIPKAVIERTPTAGLWQGQTDEQEMGFTYDEIDRYLLTGEGSPELRRRIETLRARSEHKRTVPPRGPVPPR